MKNVSRICTNVFENNKHIDILSEGVVKLQYIEDRLQAVFLLILIYSCVIYLRPKFDPIYPSVIPFSKDVYTEKKSQFKILTQWFNVLKQGCPKY